MTAGPPENAAATATQVVGETAASEHETAAQQQHEISGSAVAIEDAASPDDIAVPWSPADANAQPSLSPSEPPPVSRPGNHPPAA